MTSADHCPDTTPAPPIVELGDVSKIYGTNSRASVLAGIDLRIERGEALAIVGPSGSGKSTLLNIIGMLDLPTGGSYTFDGIDVMALDERTRGAIRGARLGFIFQAFHLLPRRTVVENIELGLLYSGMRRKARRARVEESIESLGLAHRRDAFASELSGGEKQRTAIARAVCSQPDLLLCDEPTGNLDSENTRNVMQSLKGLNDQGQTLVVVTHDLEVAALAHRIVDVTDGRLTGVPHDPAKG
ncbi:uncharacterized ABC transporter ATP-binding protein YknY (plasmid) [Arthrobacter sp. Hiyo8]|uniref:ABC transporter ATP-binding protein n=1 Tax=Arthrobacter sp. Hiyo1 TaxID=1588020 RepID=UPI0006838B6E|nr:ABC transporter ATP-binding protein [Arthrobacter sp. Hiyo1]BAS18395.1 uncharacterized ABC transporter ATP-binding protein YknY [Arthrobacter sp. Hiyo8]GAP61466.1 uncharacterized ABC transporter ATP-binding protein YknY [Arthrobacter sp. Hiyo1]